MPGLGAVRGVHEASTLGLVTSDAGRTRERRKGTDCVIVVDVQNDFVPPNGALAVPGGDEIVESCARCVDEFERVILSQDYHPSGHASFASAHDGAKPYDVTELSYGQQTLWQDHCVMGTEGCEFHKSLPIPSRSMVVRKGFDREVDSYSAFFENDRKTDTGLRAYLESEGVERVFVIGLAYDFCVKYTALDAKRLGYEVYVVRDCCRGVGLPGSMESAEEELAEADVRLIESMRDAPP